MPFDADTGFFEHEKGKPLVLLLSGVAREGILSTLHAAGRQYKTKVLESRVENWRTILKHFDDYKVECVLAKIGAFAMSCITDDDYVDVSESLFSKIGSVPHIIFIYEDILAGRLEAYHDIQNFEESRGAALALLDKCNLRVMPYMRNAEVTIMAETFLSEIEKHLVFRLYVPSGRMWSSESDKLLQLFRDYLAKVANISVRLDQSRTDKGVIYEIHSEDIARNSNIGREFSEFTNFLDLCASDIGAAEQILRDKAVDSKEVLGMLSRYAKEAKRLSIDLKHERERKVLTIRQRLESELADLIPSTINSATIESLVNRAVPQLTGLQEAISVDQEVIRLPARREVTNLTINLNPQIVETVNGIVAKEINGNQHLGQEPQQLLDLIKQYGGKDTRELTSSVHELEDGSAPSPGRLNAKQKIKKFLIDVGGKVGDVGLHVLQSYIEKKLGL